MEKELKTTHSKEIYKHILALLQISKGCKKSHIAKMLHITRATVYNWIHRYKKKKSIGALQRRPGQGRPPIWAKKLTEFLLTIMKQSPMDFGYLQTRWNAPALLRHFNRQTKCVVSRHTLRRCLNALGYKWKRFQYALNPGPGAAKKNGKFHVKSAFCLPQSLFWPWMKRISAYFPSCALDTGWWGKKLKRTLPAKMPSESSMAQSIFEQVIESCWFAKKSIRKISISFWDGLTFITGVGLSTFYSMKIAPIRHIHRLHWQNILISNCYGCHPSAPS